MKEGIDHRYLLTTIGTPIVVLTMGTLLIGCAARSNPALERARANYLQAVQDPEIITNAPVPLKEAETALRKAEEVDKEEKKTQLAYLANQKVETARAAAQKKMAEAEAQRLGEERDRVVLDARTRQAQQAQEQAALAQQQALSAEARARQLALELSEFKARETERGLVLTLGDVLFEYDRAELKSGALRNLYPLVTFLRENPGRNVLIEGHTDSIGSDSYNIDLSQRRADAVRSFLLQNGLGPERMTIQGYGESYPVASNDSDAGRQQNRRVELVVLHEGQVATRRTAY